MISMQVPSLSSEYLPGIDIISARKNCYNVSKNCLLNFPTLRDDREQLPVGATLGNTHNIYTIRTYTLMFPRQDTQRSCEFHYANITHTSRKPSTRIFLEICVPVLVFFIFLLLLLLLLSGNLLLHCTVIMYKYLCLCACNCIYEISIL